MYTIAYLPYPRPSDHPAYRDSQALYPGLLAVQEPVSQTVFLYRLKTGPEKLFPKGSLPAAVKYVGTNRTPATGFIPRCRL